MNNTTNLPGTSKIKRHFLFLGYAIIQIPDFLINAYAYIERWLRIRRQAISNHNNDVSNNSLSPDPLLQENTIMVSELETQITKENHSQTQTFGRGEEIAELREETNIKFEKLEKMLEKMNGQLKKLAYNEDTG